MNFFQTLVSVDILASSHESQMFFYIYQFIYLFFWLHWVFVAVHGLSPVAVSGGHSLLRCAGFSLPLASLCCGAQALGSRASVVVARGL